MLTEQQIQYFAKLAKLDAAALTTAISSTEPATLELPEVTALTADELTRVKSASYNDGKVAGVEIEIKAAKQKLGLDTTSKTIDGVIEAANKKAVADAGIEPTQKVTELQKDLQMLRQQNETLNATIAEKDKTVTQVKTERAILPHIPSFGENGPAISTDTFLQLARMEGYDFELNEAGVPVAKKGGEVLKDNLANPLSVKDVLTQFAKEKKFITEVERPTGRGAGDGKQTAVYTKYSDLEKDWKAQGKSVMGEEFSNKVQELAKNPDFKIGE